MKLPNIFGDGSDGDAVWSTNDIIDSDKQYNSLHVLPGAILSTNGSRIFVRGRLLNEGTIKNDGSAASGVTGGFGGAGDTVAGGISGADGRTTTGAGASAIDWTTQVLDNRGEGGGGGGAGANVGGEPTDDATNFVQNSAFENIVGALVGSSFTDAGLVSPEGGGGGGAGGNASGSGTNGGAGGGGGGTVMISAKTIDNSRGTIQAKGGAGSAATGGGNAGGGGGGGGGRIVLLGIDTSQGTLSVAGGAGGAKVGTGVAGVAGSAGSTFVVSGV